MASSGPLTQAREVATSFSFLPEELVRHILGLCPVLTLARLRLVCRAWNRIITTQHADPRPMDWCLVFRRNSQAASSFRAFDPVASKWLELELPSSLPETGGLVATSGGLVALVESFHMDGHYWIGNPLRGIWERICPPADPAVPDKDIPNAHYTELLHEMIVDEEKKSFKLVQFQSSLIGSMGSTTGADFYKWVVEVYDSSDRAWKRGVSIGQGWELLSPQATAVSKGVVYLLHGCTNQVGIIGYDVEKDHFEEIVCLTNPALETSFSFADCWLMLDEQANAGDRPPAASFVTGYFDGDLADSLQLDGDWVITGIRVMEFNPTLQVWTSRKNLELEARYRYGLLDCGGGLKHFYIAFGSDPYAAFWMYRADHGSWTELPPVDAPPEQENFGWENVTCLLIRSYAPRLDIEP